MKKKIKKPKNLTISKHSPYVIASVDKIFCEIYIPIQYLKLKKAKRLHAWLSKSIAYLEQEKK